MFWIGVFFRSLKKPHRGDIMVAASRRHYGSRIAANNLRNRVAVAFKHCYNVTATRFLPSFPTVGRYHNVAAMRLFVHYFSGATILFMSSLKRSARSFVSRTERRESQRPSGMRRSVSFGSRACKNSVCRLSSGRKS